MNALRRKFADRWWTIWRRQCYAGFAYATIAFVGFVTQRYIFAGVCLALAAGYLWLAYCSETNVRRLLK